MSERKNIDRLFQEKFKDFEAEPSELAWGKIEARLEEKKDRKIIPIWFRLAGVAAALLIGLWIANSFRTSKNINPAGNSVVVTPGSINGPDANKNNVVIVPKAKKASVTDKNNPVVTTSGETNRTVQGTSIDAPSATEKANADGGPLSAGENLVGEKANNGGQKATGGKPALKESSTRSSKNSAIASESAAKTRLAKRHSPTSGKPEIAGQNVNGEAVAASNKNKAHKKSSSRSGNTTDALQKLAGTQSPKKSGQEHNDQTGIARVEPVSGKTNQNNKNNNPLTVNENNQSGKPGQHNESKVTETTTTSTQAIAAKTDDTKKDSTAVATVDKPNALEELLNEKENKSVTESEPKINRWQVTSNVAPIYLSSSSQGSPIDSRFAANSKEYKTKLSYGLGVNYALNKKWSVRAGVNNISLEYTTNDVVFSQAVNARQLEHVKPNLQGSLLEIQTKSQATGSLPELALNGNEVQKFNGSINQKTGYIEVPVELSYKLLDRRFGVELVGGVSTLFLNQNEISIASSDAEMEIGKATNLNQTHFSTNVGVGIKYNIIKALQFNLEPMFKYQLNTFTDSGNFKPYFFGFYTGLNYRF